MIHHDAIEQAVEHQLEVERKAAAWDLLVKHLQDQANEQGKALLGWMQAVEASHA